ncbi:hypothetical protein A4X13_0g2856 [Tilletia indica]|uniref:Glycosylphosphatidylinositol anchor biosynthesis protein 11 n=1 Tax=Tilletia indica TaxID=43049 RepID=A0A8T8T689_9BASI|nr:hypothetical protein A4X13_0g2856 [Tilletia indica]
MVTPLSLHSLHLIFLLGILQPSLLFLSLFYLPQRAASSSSTLTSTTESISIFSRGFHAIALLYDNPDSLPPSALLDAVLPSAAIAIFITQAYITRALGKWINTEQRRYSSESTGSGSLEQLAMTILTLPLSTTIFLAILTGLLGAPIPFTTTSTGTTETTSTLALSFHLAILLALVPAHVLGADLAQWDVVFLPAALSSSTNDDKKRKGREAWHAVVFYPVVGALAGGLLSGFGLALDWGRPWQAWPLPPLVGSSAGLILGNWLGIRAWSKAAWSARVASG